MTPQTSPIQAMEACKRVIAMIERSQAMAVSSRSAGDDAIGVPLVRYALAQLRQRICPALSTDWASNDPIHVVMFGGTNSGKSTVLNVLLGRAAAGMSYRARFSQHPEAYRAADLGNSFVEAFPTRFAGYQRYSNTHPPRRNDLELRAQGYLYAVAINDPTRLERQALAPLPTAPVVYWDVPDFSTEEALLYMPAVLDTIALADLVVMTVTKENYADHRGQMLRGLICASGVPLRVVANKLEDGSHLLADIQLKLADSADQACRVAPDHLHPLPHVKDVDEPGRLRQLLLDQGAALLRQAVLGDVAGGLQLKKQALRGAILFLDRRLDDLLVPLKAEVSAGEHWNRIVERATQAEFYDRYRRDYLDGEKYVDFNQTLIKLLDLLEVPGIGPIISAISKGLRAVSNAIVGAAAAAFRGFFQAKPASQDRAPESDTVIACVEHWIETLKNEAQVQADRDQHPAWKDLARQIGSHQFMVSFTKGLGTAYLHYREQMDRITDERARALYEIIRRNPKLLHSLRGLKLALDAGTTGLIVASHGLNWTDAVIAPLVIPVQRLLLEYGVEKYLDVQKARLKDDQFAAFGEMIETHMVAPVRQLFVAAVRPEEMAGVRHDFDIVKAAVLDIAS
jgi:hypothetical protein